MTALRIAAALTAICAVSACGGYSTITTEDGREPRLPEYTTAVVIDFNDATTPEQELVQENLAEHRKKVAAAGRRFADLIAARLVADEVYAVVLREPSPADAILITGDITRYVEGDTATRLLMGMISGRSRLDGEIQFSDNRSGDAIGAFNIAKKSWALGGLFAAGQTVEDYITDGAEAVTIEIKRAKEKSRTDGPTEDGT